MDVYLGLSRMLVDRDDIPLRWRKDPRCQWTVSRNRGEPR
jgi:hypothetical protein